MNPTYTQDKPEMLRAMWLMMEEMQDIYPYCWIGWYGFMPVGWWVYK